MAIPVQKFRSMPAGLSEGISKMLQGAMSGYGQGLQAQQAHQQMRKQAIMNQSLPEQLKVQLATSQEKLREMPQQMDLNQRRMDLGEGQLQQSVNRFTDPRSLALRWANTDAGKVAMSQSPELAGAADRLIKGTFSQADQKLLGPMSQQVQPDGQSQQKIPEQPSEQQKNSLSSRLTGIPSTQEGASQIQDVLQSEMQAKSVPEKVRNQRFYSETLSELFGEADKDMPSVAKFAGALGQAELKEKRLAASLGQIDPDYQKYYEFTTTTVPFMASELRKMLGDNATDSQIQEIKSIADPVSWDSNFELSMGRYKKLKGLHGAINKALVKSQAGITKSISDRIRKSNVPRGTQNNQYLSVKDGKVMGPDGKWYSAEDLV